MWLAIWTAIKFALPFLKRWIPNAWLDALGGAIGSYLKSKDAELAAKATIAVAEIKAEQAARSDAAEILKLEHGWAVTRWIRPLIAYPLVIYWGLIVFDKLIHFEWEAEPLPTPLDEWAGWIITAYFLTRPIEKVARLFKGS